MVIHEIDFFTDDAKYIGDMLKHNWSLKEKPNIVYDSEQYRVNGRIGYILVRPMNGNFSNVTTDYQAMDENKYVYIKFGVPFRERMFEWGREIIRILLSERRVGQLDSPYSKIEITGEKFHDEAIKWYSATIDVRLVSYCKPIRTAGFGEEINKAIEDIYLKSEETQ